MHSIICISSASISPPLSVRKYLNWHSAHLGSNGSYQSHRIHPPFFVGGLSISVGLSSVGYIFLKGQYFWVPRILRVRWDPTTPSTTTWWDWNRHAFWMSPKWWGDRQCPIKRPVKSWSKGDIHRKAYGIHKPSKGLAGGLYRFIMSHSQNNSLFKTTYRRASAFTFRVLLSRWVHIMAAASLSPLSPNVNEDMETSDKAWAGDWWLRWGEVRISGWRISW